MNRPSGMTLSEAQTLLGLDQRYTAEDIEARFRLAARSAHPDRGGDAESFRRLVEARTRTQEALRGNRPDTRTQASTTPPAPVVVINTDSWLERRWKALVARLSKRPPRDLE